MDGTQTRVAGINGTTADKGNTPWLNLYDSVCQGNARSTLCCAAGCMNTAGKGGHVWLFDPATRRFGKQHAFIAPICDRHNNREFDYPKPGFLLKRGTRLMRMVPHACYADYDLDFVYDAQLMA